MKIASHAVTMTEVPHEISLTLSISNCPFRCEGCHTAELREDVGTELTEKLLSQLIAENPGITAVVFLGAGSRPKEIVPLAQYIRTMHGLKVGLYTGASKVSLDISANLDFIKLGSYDAEKGPLSSETTNQRFYRLPAWEDITHMFRKFL